MSTKALRRYFYSLGLSADTRSAEFLYSPLTSSAVLWNDATCPSVPFVP